MKFKTIYADPPWKYNDTLDKTRHKPYDTLSVDDLCKLKVKEIVEDQAHLYLWVTGSFLEEAFSIIRAWDFDYKCYIPWLKRTKTGKIWFGMGHYFRYCTELCLFATRNNFKLKTKNTRNFIDAMKPENRHSGKPIEMYDLIEANSYPLYLELFATETRGGWDSIGYEIDDKDIREIL